MICLICRQAEITVGVTSASFQRGDESFIVKNIPARTCLSCGEAYLEEEVALFLLQCAEKISVAGMRETEFEFNQLV